MRILTTLFLLLSLNLFGQDTSNVRTLGATPTDITVLTKMDVAIPQSAAIGSIPSSFRMDSECPPVSNQCNIGSCVSQATGYGLCGILAKRQNNWSYYDNSNNLDFNHLFSPMYMHFYIKGCNYDCGRCGSSLGAAANYLMRNGIPTFQSWHPNQCDQNSCNYQPNPSQSAFIVNSARPLFVPGVQYQYGYKRNAIKYFVSQNNPIPIAMELDQSFMNGSAFNNRKDTWSNFVGQSIGGHAMLIVGYDDNRGAFLVMNSWGENWNTNKNDPSDDAKPGYCWIGYDVIEYHCFEAFVANENQTSYSIPMSELLNTSNSIKTQTEVKTNKVNDVEFFITNRFNPYNDIRLIPMSIDKSKGEATIAIYEVKDNEPLFFSAFNIKVNETNNFEVNGHKYSFKALYIKQWTFLGKNALYYQITIDK